MRSKSYLFLLLVLALGALSGWLYTTQKFNYGLDVRGGVRFTYQMDTSKLTTDQKANLDVLRTRLLGILQNRAVGPLGVTEPTVVSKGRDQFVIELPGFTDATKARQVIGSSARIEFYHAKNVATRKATYRPYTPRDAKDASDPAVEFTRRTGNGEPIVYGSPEYANIIKGWDLILSGDELERAEPQIQGNRYEPLMKFSPEGAKKMENFTRRYMNRNENIASVLDGKVLSIAGVVDNTILSDNAVINGTFSPEYVTKLTNLLNAGALPVDLIPLSTESVDPTIGATALDQIVRAGMISFGIISLFLLVYYAFPGLVALIALGLYVLFTLTVLKLINATFSLAAIAGFILSVGMAVDANILVFERFKEEMKRGKSLQTAINLGFNRALPAIIDSNACTILTSLVLAGIGTGPVKGFATTLIIGVLISLFTAVFVTRSLLMFLVGSGIGDNPAWYAVDRNWFGKGIEERADTHPFRIVETAKKWFLISAVSIIVCLPFVFMGGLKPNVEFRGGLEAVFSLEGNNLTVGQMSENLEKAGVRGGNVKLGSLNPQKVSILVPKASIPAGAADARAQAESVARLAGLSSSAVQGQTTGADGALTVQLSDAAGLSAAQIDGKLTQAGVKDATATISSSDKIERAVYVTVPPDTELYKAASDQAKIDAVAKAVGLDPKTNIGVTVIGPTVQAETLRNAVIAVLLSSGLIIAYLAIRFGFAVGGFMNGLRFGFSAIGALVHDILFVIGITAVVGYFRHWEISALFITSMLTVIGFSVHDTIVIFDRIRENLKKPLPNEDFGHLVDRSITQSFARSVNTSMTVIVTLIVLLVFGTATPDLKLFCVTMLAGIVSGTYSSIYNASPILYLWDKAVGARNGDGATLMGLSRTEAARQGVITTRATVPPSDAGPVAPGTRSYGQVRRRASEVQKGTVELDD